jgi:hypothetical protein
MAGFQQRPHYGFEMVDMREAPPIPRTMRLDRESAANSTGSNLSQIFGELSPTQ